MINWKNIMEKLTEYGEVDRTFDNRIYYFVQSHLRIKRMGLPTPGISFTDAALYTDWEPIGYINEDGIHMYLDNKEANLQYKGYIERQLSNL